MLEVEGLRHNDAALDRPELMLDMLPLKDAFGLKWSRKHDSDEFHRLGSSGRVRAVKAESK
jgi:hypothetical protein